MAGWALGAVLSVAAATACGAVAPPSHLVEVDAAPPGGAPPRALDDRATGRLRGIARERVWIETEAAAFTTNTERAAGGIPYDCRDFGPTRAPAARPVPSAIEELVRVVDPASSDGLVPTEAIAAALDAAAALDPAALLPFERVVLQNTALSVVLRASSDDVGALPRARGIVQAFALDAEALDALGAEIDPVADRWIGPRLGWKDRKGDACGDGRLLRHDRTYGGARAFRPLRSGDTRALVAQLVAIDTQGVAHVTPFVGEIEVLRGEGDARTTCVAELDADGLRDGAPGGLRRVQRDEVPRTKFIKANASGNFSCSTCHTNGGGVGDFEDVSVEEGATLGTNRRRAAAALLGRAVSGWIQSPWSL